LDLFASSTDLPVLTQPVFNQRQSSLLLLSESCFRVHSNSVVTRLPCSPFQFGTLSRLQHLQMSTKQSRTVAEGPVISLAGTGPLGKVIITQVSPPIQKGT